MEAAWPFKDPPNLAVITLASILSGARPILLVLHDADDGSWQFLADDPDPDIQEGRVVALAEMVEHDPTVAELADLPLGWVACRQHQRSEWVRQRGEY